MRSKKIKSLPGSVNHNNRDDVVFENEKITWCKLYGANWIIFLNLNTHTIISRIFLIILLHCCFSTQPFNFIYVFIYELFFDRRLKQRAQPYSYGLMTLAGQINAGLFENAGCWLAAALPPFKYAGSVRRGSFIHIFSINLT